MKVSRFGLRLLAPALLLMVATAVMADGGLQEGSARKDSRSGRSMKWWQSDRFREELALTAEQSARIEEIFQAMLPKLRAAKGDLDRLDGTLSKLVAEGTADEAIVAQQIDRVEAARSELSKTRTLMLFRMHRILSADQRAKLKTLHEQWERERRPDHSRGR